MADEPILLFRKVFGSLRPSNRAAEEFLASMDSDKPLRGRFTRTNGNQRRMALYWACIGITVDNLSDRVEGGLLTIKSLHRKLKRDLGLATPIISRKTGEILDWDYDSISFYKMPENERAAFIDQALTLMSRWLGCDVTDLRREGEAEAA